NNMFFTIWYGVLDRRFDTLASACAGHPPALLVRPGGAPPERLGERGLVLGGMPGTVYRSSTCGAPPGSKLFLVSDGAYEIHRDGHTMLDLAGLERMLVEAARSGDDELDRVVAQVRALHGEGALDDDLSILKVCV
ncbi:MAG: PP2C family protein-serine/threonine phosphatase, partial [Chloroflexota bacterium]